jgi:hypothetical protein
MGGEAWKKFCNLELHYLRFTEAYFRVINSKIKEKGEEIQKIYKKF